MHLVAKHRGRESLQEVRLHHEEGDEGEEAEHRELRPDAVEDDRELLESLLESLFSNRYSRIAKTKQT